MTRMAARLLLVVLVCPSLAAGQSLAEVARKEQERRKKNKAAGVQAKVITEDQLGAKGKSSGEATAPPAANTPEARPPAPAVDDDGERQVREQQEQYWRSRMAAARAEVTRHEDVLKELEKLSLVPGESYVDDSGQTVIRDLAHLREMVANAQRRLADARRAVDDLEDEARRQGALPGWLR